MSHDQPTHTPGTNPTYSQNTRIIFMGTPAFAVASLDALVNAGFNVIAVITAPDKPAGRGMKLQQSDVKKYAEEKGLKVLQPQKLKDPHFLEELKNLKADLQIIVAFRMLPEVVWAMPPMGTINVHASLLPQYRGAAPINWAIIKGEKETGVTTFKLQHEIDTGNILLQEKVTIKETETAGELHDTLKNVGANLLVQTIHGILDGTVGEKPQVIDEASSKHAPKIFTDTCKIDWDRSIDEVQNLIRGLSPYPGAFTQIDGKKFKIFAGEKVSQAPTKHPGEIETDNKKYIRFACTDGYINVLEAQLEGKKRMPIEDLLRGFKIEKD